MVVENVTLYFIRPVQIESKIELNGKILEVGRKHGKVDVELYYEGAIVGKAMMMVQLLDR
jgi:predicted transcriptional regulator